MKSLFSPIGFAVAAALIAAVLSGCDSSNFESDPDDRPDAQHLSQIAADAVQAVTVSPVIGKSGQTEFLLNIQFRKNRRGLRLPKGLNILSRRKGDPNIVIYDDGFQFDDRAGDGLYTGIIPDGCMPNDATIRTTAAKKLDFTCTFEFVGPGQACGEFGECPDRVHRSLLWGLIQYETDILFCVCIVECEVTKD